MPAGAAGSGDGLAFASDAVGSFAASVATGSALEGAAATGSVEPGPSAAGFGSVMGSRAYRSSGQPWTTTPPAASNSATYWCATRAMAAPTRS